jgi:Tfp pilus assembly protein FimT
VVIALPNLERARIRSRTIGGVRAVSNLLDRTRAEALKRRSPVVLNFNSGNRVFTIFEDWDPANGTVGTNNDGNLNGNEERIDILRLDRELTWASAPSGDSSPLPQWTSVSYGPDGALQGAGGAAYLQDTKGNVFRIRVNVVTGSTRTEKWLGASNWSPRREDWNWYY